MNDFSRICPNCCTESGDGGGYCHVCNTDAASIKNEEFCIPAGSVLLDRYYIGKVIGQGGFGITYLGYDAKLETKIALKEYFLHGYAFREIHKEKHTIYSLSGEKTEFYNRGIEKFIAEARRLAQFSGAPGIVNVRDYFNENNTAYIVMEFVEGEPLGDILKKRERLSESEVAEIFLPILKTLQKVHSAGILHRDIAPDNIMVEPDGTARLIDFGASAEVDENAATSVAVIKHFYVPEEQYDTNRRRQGPWTDVYAISATIFRALEGATLPDSHDRLRGMPFDGFTVPVSEPVKNAVTNGVALFPKDRAQTVDELIDAFSVPSGTAVYKKPKTPKTIIDPSEENKKTSKKLMAILGGIAATVAVICLVIFLPRASVPTGVESGEGGIDRNDVAGVSRESISEATEASASASDVTVVMPAADVTTTTTTTAETTTVPETTTTVQTTASETTASETTTAVTTNATTTTAQTTTPRVTTTTTITTVIQKSGAVKDFEYSVSDIGGGKFTGTLKDGKPEGKGVLSFEDDGSYDGEWKDGRPEGQGTVVYANVLTYTGGWKAGQYDGQGTLELAGGDKYVGEFKNGQKNGKGKQYISSIPDLKPGTYRIEEGTFIDGYFSGDFVITMEFRDGWSVTEYHNADDEKSGTYTFHVVKKHTNGRIEEFDSVIVNGQDQGRINYVTKNS
jgi:serine/threonine protein kinase